MKGYFLRLNNHANFRFCDVCESRIPLEERFTMVLEYFKEDVVTKTYCDSCWYTWKKAYKDYENISCPLKREEG